MSTSNGQAPRPIQARPDQAEDENIGRLLHNIASEGKRLNAQEPGAREALLAQARDLVFALESPLDGIYAFLFEPARLCAGRLALDLDIFDTLAADNGRPKSVAELAKPKAASPKLVQRALRHLAAMRMIDQTGAEEFAQNKVSRYLAYPKYREGLVYINDCVAPSLNRTPEYLSTTNYKNPEDTNDGPFQFAHNTPNHWVWIEQRPRVLTAFQDYLDGVRSDRPNFMDPGFYPVQERLIDGLQHEGYADAFVDVGGGHGHVLAEFKEKTPAWNGRLVLQDQDSVIDIAKTQPFAPVMEAKVHDFFQPQTVRGARAYYMRYILHDWPDEECRTILRHLKDAMTPGYSKILIHECVLADRDPSWQHTGLDFFMMALFSTLERTESEWHALLGSVGLKITGIYTKATGDLSLIEVMA